MTTLLAVVDDDVSVRESVHRFLRSLGYDVASFDSADAFFASTAPMTARCLILDVQMPHVDGPELQRRLIVARSSIPVIFITSHPDPTLRAMLIAAGAIDCLYKPFKEEALIEVLDIALARSP